MTQAASASIEYNIYTFDTPNGKSKGDAKWQLNTTTKDMKEAISKAQNLLGTKKFQKVEVKQKFFDEKKNRQIDMTLKTYEYKDDSILDIIIIIMGALVCGMGAFALTYYLTMGA